MVSAKADMKLITDDAMYGACRAAIVLNLLQYYSRADTWSVNPKALAYASADHLLFLSYFFLESVVTLITALYLCDDDLQAMH